MCGISGYRGPGFSSAQSFQTWEKVQAHRGPDHQATHRYSLRSDAEGSPQAIFSHQRLSIIDLSTAAHQPYEDENYSLVFNGEIYNYIELRDQLKNEGVVCRTSSDTEVLFRGLLHWGIEKTLRLCNGMWAFALLDKRTLHLTVARDRYGIKPLYYYQDEDRFYFASEAKTILEMTGKSFPLNRRVAAAYLSQALLEYEPEETFFQGMRKIPPGCIASIPLGHKGPLQFERYYELKVQPALVSLSFPEASKQLDTTLRQSVEMRLRADVPVGILLSGGIDSSILASLSHQVHSKPVSFLSYVSDEKRYDESPFMKILSKHLGIQPHYVSIDVNSDSLFDDLLAATWHNDQPLHSFSAYAHRLLMKKARELGITVLLTGQGADEAFCGYRKYWPFYVKELMARGQVASAIRTSLQVLLKSGIFTDLSFSEVRRYLPAFGQRPPPLLSKELRESTQRIFLGLKPDESVNERQIRDVLSLSVPSLLHYEDRMSMAESREVREVFLDSNIVDLGVALPTSFKLHQGWTKYILRKTFESDLPPEIAWRRDKKGFTSPQATWLRRELRPRLEALLQEDLLMCQFGLMDRESGRRTLQEAYAKMCAGSGLSDDRLIFRIIAMELFLRAFKGKVVA